ncbi:DNA mismatch repair protein [Marasmius tenuissimus]|nr:DNA mismatch repair protein [Marasmius tenuissimus]
MVKSFLAQVDSDHLLDVLRHRIPVSESEQRKESNWLKALRWCPSHLLELVNSKACRGAIMFNDPLNNEQCERLVQQLSETALPFQCAHGRPSLVPLTNFGQLAGDRGKYRHSQVNWSALEEQT